MEKYRIKYVQSKKGGREATPCDKCFFDEDGICMKDKNIKDIDGKDCVDDDEGAAYFVRINPERRRRRKLSKDAIAFIMSEEGSKMSARSLGRKYDVTHGIIIRARNNNKKKPKE